MAERPVRAEPAVFLLSAAVLSFEVLLLRLFAIEHFHHFASMAIGMAMLGFGASGTALVLLRRRLRGRERRWFAAAAAAFTVSLVAAVPLAHTVAFDPTQILWDAQQWRALAFVYASLALPFTLGAAALALALMDAGASVGRVYGANLLGSGVGSLLALALLAVFHPARAVAATAVPAAAGAALALLARDDALQRPSPVRWTTAVALLLLALGATARPPWTPRITPFKGLPQVAAFEGARPAGERWGPLGWVVAIHAAAFRHAPGLSLGFTGTLPPQTALFVDGAIAGAATDAAGDDAALEFLRWLPSSAAYAGSPSPPRRVLVLGAGDGMDAIAALAHGAMHVTAVEPNTSLTGLAGDVVAPAARVYADPRVARVASDARTFAARTSLSWDLIVLPVAAGGFGGATVGGLGEDYGNTVEAYAVYLARLGPDGVLAVTRWVDTPPRDAAKVLLTAAAALRRRGVAEPGGALALVRSWAAATLLVKPTGFGTAELQRMRAFARARFFDVDWPPDPAATEFNLLDRPVFTEAARAAAQSSAQAEAYARAYPFDIAPPTDDRPWSGRFLRLSSIPSLLATSRGSWLPFAEWGYLALVATLLQSALIAALLILLPALALTRRRPDGRGDAGDAERPAARAMAVSAIYFGALGGAYLFVEIALIQKLTLVLGHPVHAAAAVLALCLAFSGAGSLWSDRLAPAAASRAALAAAVAALVVAAALELMPRVQPLPFAGRLAASLLLLAPLATAMGMPFPLGLRRHADGDAAVAWAWAVNGFASVVAASLAALVALEAGIRALLLAGTAFYLIAAASARGRSLPRRPGDA